MIRNLLSSYASRKMKRELLAMRVIALTLVFLSDGLFAQNRARDNAFVSNEEALIDQYVSSKGQEIIVFDSINIKQFWIDKSVYSKENNIYVSLDRKQMESYESIPLKIQLANVNETHDCRIEVIANDSSFSFMVLNSSLKTIAESEPGESFLNYKTLSANFHLEDTAGLSFYLKFISTKQDCIHINKIVLSFSRNNNSSFFSQPRRLFITEGDVDVFDYSSAQAQAKKEPSKNQNGFYVTGNISVIMPSMIQISNKKLFSSVTIKNTGDEATTISLGYIFYNKDKVKQDGRNFPYRTSSKVLTVLSSSKDSNKIIVDSYDDWRKGCCLGINAKEDMSDIPNNSLVGGTIAEITKLDDGKAEITLTQPLKETLTKGTKVRIQGATSETLFLERKTLQPGEEKQFNAIIQRDDKYYQYVPSAFSDKFYYFRSVIDSRSINSKPHTILIQQYNIVY